MTSRIGLESVRPAGRTTSRRPVLGYLTTSAGRETWQRRYVAAAITTDVASVASVVLLGYVLGLGSYVPRFGEIAPGVGIVAGLLMLAALFVCRAWDPQALGHGIEEFSRLIRAVVTSGVVLALLGLALTATAARPWVFGLMPLGGLLAVLGRLALRERVRVLRERGHCMQSVLAVGPEDAVADLIDRTRRDRRRGWVVSGICTPAGAVEGAAEGENGSLLDVPVLGDLDDIAKVARSHGHRVVAVCPTPGFTGKRLHHLAWALEGQAVEIVVDPGLMEVADPRLHVSPVDGFPLLRLTQPTFTGASWILKYIADRLGSALLLLLTAPLFIALAIGVKLDGGPVFFRQTRVGRHGKTFRMLKFRSMVVDAERLRANIETANEGAGPLFKMKRDPRVTRFGAFLRRYSLDELPQLINVLAGSMSLVGPRPPLPAEVVKYARDAQRRLLVKPGLTGLWQVSGRSDLSWEQSVRLDLRYVENWNLALDAQILWRTVGAVMGSRGAY